MSSTVAISFSGPSAIFGLILLSSGSGRWASPDKFSFFAIICLTGVSGGFSTVVRNNRVTSLFFSALTWSCANLYLELGVLEFLSAYAKILASLIYDFS